MIDTSKIIFFWFFGIILISTVNIWKKDLPSYSYIVFLIILITFLALMLFNFKKPKKIEKYPIILIVGLFLSCLLSYIFKDWSGSSGNEVTFFLMGFLISLTYQVILMFKDNISVITEDPKYWIQLVTQGLFVFSSIIILGITIIFSFSNTWGKESTYTIFFNIVVLVLTGYIYTILSILYFLFTTLLQSLPRRDYAS